MVPGPKINNRYLAYALKRFTPQIEALGNTTTFKEVSRTAVKNFEIPLPPLAEQERIADILDTADSLCQKDQELLQKYDELAQNIFYEMFGDPVRNEMGWDVKELQSVCTKVTDGTHDTPTRLSSGVKFITGKHIRAGKIDFDNSDYVTDEVHQEIYRRCNPELGDVLYTNIGANLGTAAYNSVEFEFSMKNVALLKPDVRFLNGLYLQHLLNTPRFKQRAISESGVGGAQQFLSLKQLRNLKIVVPPLPHQVRFHDRVQKVSEIMQCGSQAAAKSGSLFSSLLSFYFS